jgi:hypothetical protein
MSTSFGPKIIIPNFYLDTMNKKCFNRNDPKLFELIKGYQFDMSNNYLNEEKFVINKDVIMLENSDITKTDGTIEFVLYFQSLPTELVGTEYIYNTDNLTISIKEGQKNDYLIIAKNSSDKIHTLNLSNDLYRYNIHYSLSFYDNRYYNVYVNGAFEKYTDLVNSTHSGSLHSIGGDFDRNFLLIDFGINIFRIYNTALNEEQIDKNFNSIKKRSYLRFDYN